jgi:hypothetical protein
MRLTVISHLTLDGVMQDNGKPEPERNDGFEQGGWQVPYFDQDLDIYQPSGKAQYGSVAPAQEGEIVTGPVSRPAGP